MSSGRTKNFEDWLRCQSVAVRVLLIEDNADDIQLFLRYTANRHMVVQVAKSGEEALAILNACAKCGQEQCHPLRLIFLDWMMGNGGLSGEALFAAIKEVSPKVSPDLATIVLSGYICEALAKSVSKHGFAPMIQKPECYSSWFFDQMMDAFNIPKAAE